MRTIHLQIIIVILTIIFTAVTFVPIVARSIRTDPSRVNLYIHSYQNDYMQYVAQIMRGQHGLFWYKNPFSVPHPAVSPLFLLFSIIGIITAPFGIWPPFAYHIFRVLMIFFSVWTTYILAVTVLKSKRWGSVATILTIITANPPSFLYSEQIAKSFKPWWDILTVNARFDGLPHHLAARGLQCLAIACYVQYRSTKQWRSLALSSIAATISVFMVPQAVTPYVMILGVSVVWDGICQFRKTKQGNVFLREWGPLLALIAPIAAVGVMYLATENPLWVANKQWEVTYFGRDPWTNYHLYISYVFLLLPAYVGFIIGFKRKELLSIQLLIWILTPLLFTPILPLLGTGGARFALQINLVIPLSILATVAIREALNVRFWKRIAILYIICMCLYLPYSVIGYSKGEWDFMFAENLSTRMYTPKEYFELVDWVKTNVPQDHVILASEEIGSLLVSQTPVFAYIGDQTHGSNWDLLIDAHTRFYSEQMDPQEALTWLKNHDVSYVVEDPKYIWPLKDLSYPFLVKRWQNYQVGIYEVNYNIGGGH